jgi:hypothetical protein
MHVPFPRLLAGSLLLCAACGFGYIPPEPPSPRDATQVNASMGRTWNAVIDLFAARTIPIRTIERSSGIIVTEQLSVGVEGDQWADCGKSKGWGGTNHYAPNFATYNVLVRGDSAHSSVKTTVRWVLSDFKHPLAGNEVTECSTKHVFERLFEAETKSRAEAPKVADQARAEPADRSTQSTVGIPPEAQSVPPLPDTISSSTGTTADAPAQLSPTAEPMASGGGRSNEQLLAAPDFSRAIRDLKVLQFLNGFRERGADTLQVEVSDDAATHIREYNLRGLFNAYHQITNWSPRATIVLSYRSRLVGTYTERGLAIVGERQ